MGAGHCSGAGEQQCSSRRACGGCGRGGPGHTYLLSFCSTGRAGQMAGHPHRAFQRIPPHRFSSHLDGCLSSQLGHRTLKNERGRLSSHRSQCGNPPALVDSCRWAKLIACCAGLFLVWEPTLDTHTPLLSQLLPGEGGPSRGCCHPSSRGPASSAHPAQGSGMPWSLAQDSS